MAKRILIAEEDKASRDTLVKHAKFQGFDVTTVTNAFDLLLVAADEFDVVIMDLMMEDLDGITAANIMKLQGASTPVIALTGKYTPDTASLKKAFTKVYLKPVKVSELFDYLEAIDSEMAEPGSGEARLWNDSFCGK